ncbi:hypothetical protein HNP02_003060 [Mycobacterium sp. AZCC_0083]|nr:hypothetical protein [Mycobacterium sp. AZCC_0083]
MRHGFVTAVMAAGVMGGLAHSTPASAEPDSEMPVPPGLFHLNPTFPVPPAPAGQNPTPYVGPPVINFQRPIADRPLAQQAVHVSSNPPVPGKFYWMSDTQLR